MMEGYLNNSNVIVSSGCHCVCIIIGGLFGRRACTFKIELSVYTAYVYKSNSDSKIY